MYETWRLRAWLAKELPGFVRERDLRLFHGILGTAGEEGGGREEGREGKGEAEEGNRGTGEGSDMAGRERQDRRMASSGHDPKHGDLSSR